MNETIDKNPALAGLPHRRLRLRGSAVLRPGAVGPLALAGFQQTAMTQSRYDR